MKDVLNKKFQGYGTEKINILDNVIIDKKDVKSLVENLSKEIATKDKSYKIMNDNDSENLSEVIMKGVIEKRSMTKNEENASLNNIKENLQKHIPSNKFSKLREFIHKVAMCLDEKFKANHVTAIHKNGKSNGKSY